MIFWAETKLPLRAGLVRLDEKSVSTNIIKNYFFQAPASK
jgi:hypothetical protein